LEQSSEKGALGEFAYQELTLQQLKLSRAEVKVYLKSGIKIEGTILAFDAHVLILQRSQINQLIFKHTIATISNAG